MAALHAGSVATLRSPNGVDFVGDLHGCLDACAALLGDLGYALAFASDGSVARAVHPAGRTLVLLGDIVDRGPQVLLMVRSAMALVAGGHLVLQGNHDAALVTALRRRAAGGPTAAHDDQDDRDHGRHTTWAAIEATREPERAAVRRFLAALPHHALVDVDGAPRVVAAHAGLPRGAAGLDTDAAWRHAVYGDPRVSDSREALLSDGSDWRATYTRAAGAICVYGHHAGPAPACVAQTIGVDTGCGYPGGRLSALQWPEGVVRSVAGPVPPEPMGRPAGSARRL